ncbi:MAG: hypothetical protein ACLGJC_19320 [Alphaproteobacteria bacterium]
MLRAVLLITAVLGLFPAAASAHEYNCHYIANGKDAGHPPSMKDALHLEETNPLIDCDRKGSDIISDRDRARAAKEEENKRILEIHEQNERDRWQRQQEQARLDEARRQLAFERERYRPRFAMTTETALLEQADQQIEKALSACKSAVPKKSRVLDQLREDDSVAAFRMSNPKGGEFLCRATIAGQVVTLVGAQGFKRI